MKRILYIFTVVCIIICSVACSVKENNKCIDLLISDDLEKVHIECDTLSTHNYSIWMESILIDSGSIYKTKDIEVSKILRINKDKSKEVALIGAKNNSLLKLNIKVSDQIDTVINYNYTLKEEIPEDIAYTGFGAPLVKKSATKEIETELRIWLYRKKEHVSDSVFAIFKSIYATLTVTGYNDYVPKGVIPVVHNIDGMKYKIDTEIKADYYAVVACESQEYIEQYVEQLVGSNFDGVSTSLSIPLSCQYRKGTSGIRNVFLLCINKDWSYKQIPLATFALDNEAPNTVLSDYQGRLTEREWFMRGGISYEPQKKSTPVMLNYKDNLRIIYPPNRPLIYGTAMVEVPNWNGNGLECNVTFKITFSGDTKSVTIQRRDKKLCYYSEYIGYHFRPEDKIIYAREHTSPYIFSYQMHFEAGDNFIPIIVEDYNGNIKKGSIKIHAEFVRRNSPSINIENNIYND